MQRDEDVKVSLLLLTPRSWDAERKARLTSSVLRLKVTLMTLYATDMRSRFNDIGPDVQSDEGDAVDRSQGVARSM